LLMAREKHKRPKAVRPDLDSKTGLVRVSC